MSTHAIFESLRRLGGPRPLVAAHRGDSVHHPENTLAAFRAAAALDVPIQEFDVRQLRCGALVCVHDETFDRTTDAARAFGPGALVAQLTLEECRRLDAGGGQRVPTLRDALDVMLPHSVALIEHKAGDAARFVAEVEATGHADRCVLQSFDWRFLQEVHRIAPHVALGALGPNPVFAAPDGEAVRVAQACGAGMVHWRANALTEACVAQLHAAGVFVCSYTTDDELGWRGGAAIGIDAMCTNDPAAMQAVMATLRR